MKISQQIQRLPTSTPASGIFTRLRRADTNATLMTATSDAEGFVSFQRNGTHIRPYIHAPDIPGGDKYWNSTDATTAGPLVLQDVPLGLAALGDGVIPGFLNELRPFLTGGNTLNIDSGALILGGIPIVYYTAKEGYTPGRPTTATRYDSAYAVAKELDLTGSIDPLQAGLSAIVYINGVEGAGPLEEIVDNTEPHRSFMWICHIEIPVAAPIILHDLRTFAGSGGSSNVIVRDASAETSSTTGVALGALTASVNLPRATTYDIEATVSGYQDLTDTPASHGPKLIWGGYGNGTSPILMNTPDQLMIGRETVLLFVADTENNRVFGADGNGAYWGGNANYARPHGIADTAAGAFYVSNDGGIWGYTSYANLINNIPAWFSQIPLYPAEYGYPQLFSVGHLCTTTSSNPYWWYYGLSQTSLFAVANYSDYYSFNRWTIAQFEPTYGFFTNPTFIDNLTSPYGLCTDDTYLYVTEGGGANRVSKYDLNGTLIQRWGTTGSGNGQFSNPRGITYENPGKLWVADYGNNRMQQFTTAGVYLDQFSIDGPTGVAIYAPAVGDHLYVGSSTNHTISRCGPTEAIDAGYGQIALEIDGVVGDYTGLGNTSGWIQTAGSSVKGGPGTLTVRAMGKATSETLILEQGVLTARAIPRAK